MEYELPAQIEVHEKYNTARCAKTSNKVKLWVEELAHTITSLLTYK